MFKNKNYSNFHQIHIHDSSWKGHPKNINLMDKKALVRKKGRTKAKDNVNTFAKNRQNDGFLH